MESICPYGSCDGPQDDQSSAHFHVPCCGTIMALLTSGFGLVDLADSTVDQPIGRSILALGELRYPLLRPPCQLV